MKVKCPCTQRPIQKSAHSPITSSTRYNPFVPKKSHSKVLYPRAMDTCLCTSLHLLAQHYDKHRAKELVPALNSHLKDIFDFLSQSGSLCRDLQYRITPSNDRTNKLLSLTSVNLAPVNQVHERFREDTAGFWTVLDGNDIHNELRRRLACVVIFLRSRLNAQVLVPPQIGRLFHGQPNYANVRSSGRKYIQIARKLGGLGAIFWLPLDISPST